MPQQTGYPGVQPTPPQPLAASPTAPPVPTAAAPAAATDAPPTAPPAPTAAAPAVVTNVPPTAPVPITATLPVASASAPAAGAAQYGQNGSGATPTFAMAAVLEKHALDEVQAVAQYDLRRGQYAMASSGIKPEPVTAPVHSATAAPQPLGQTGAFTATPTSTPTPIPSFTPTPLPPTATQYQTPTPTATLTPTITSTPLPPPPWLYSRLPATDPRGVHLDAGKPQLVVFFAYWSGPSQAMTPLLLGVQNEYSPKVIFTYLDIDDPAAAPLKRSLGFRAEPQLFLLDGQGKVLRQWGSLVTLEQLRQALSAAAAP